MQVLRQNSILRPESASSFHTQQKIRKYRIVPEFDVPAHSLAMLKTYPEYASGEVEGRDSGIHSSSS